MNKLIYFVIFGMLAVQSYAQCDHNVNTDHQNPTNSALPGGPDAGKYLNGFNWFPVTPGGLYDDYETVDISFGGVTYTEMNNIMLNALPAYDYITQGPLPLTQNGWELLLVNLGKYPDDITPITAGNHLYAMPYIVLYNRYSGTVRVFLNFGIDHTVGQGADAMEVSLLFHTPSDVNGLMRLYQGYDQALDQETDVTLMKSICKAPAFGQQWASTDFQVAYDPCVCYHPSQLRIDLRQLVSSSLTLHSRSIILEDEPLLNNAQLNPLDFLNGFDYTGNTASGGILIYKTMEKMIDDYLKKYEEYNKGLVAVNRHNKHVKENLAVLKMAKSVIGLILHPPIGFIPDNPIPAEMAAELANQELLGLTEQEIIEAYEGMEGPDVNWFKVVKDLQAGIVKATASGQKIIDNEKLFGYVKKIFGEKGELFISNNFVAKDLPKAPPVPKASFMETHYEGQITQSLDIGGTNFYTPGTYGSPGTGSPTITSVYTYPVYNDALGIFALLESPKIELSKVVADHFTKDMYTEFEPTPGTVQPYYGKYESWSNNYQLQLKEDLKYKFNDVVDIANYNIQAAFSINAKRKFLGGSVSNISNGINSKTGLSLLNAFVDPNYTTNLSSTNLNPDIYDPLASVSQPYPQQAHYENVFHAQGDLFIAIGINSVSNPDLKASTPFLDVNAFKQHVAGLSVKNESFRIRSNAFNFYTPASSAYDYELEIELKLIVDVEFQTQGVDINGNSILNKLTQVLTYKIRPEDITWLTADIFPGLEGSVADITQYEENLDFENQVFDGSPVEGCELAGNHYTCQAWNDVTIQGVLNTAPGYSVDIFAGHEIYEFPESEISPEIVRAIVPLLDFSDPMPEADQSFVASFCNSLGTNSYQANRPAPPKFITGNTSETEQNTINNAPFDFTLHPNPSNAQTRLVLQNHDPRNTHVSVTDLTGKAVSVQLVKVSQNSYGFDVSGLEKGIYFVTVNSNFQQKTKQLIVH